MDVRVVIEPQQGATFEHQETFATASEDFGFNGFFRSDHLLPISRSNGLPGPTETFITLGAIARVTSRIRLGTLMCSATFREPCILAVAAAQVDQMSAGRFELGLGAGWYEDEHRTFGLRYGDPQTRFERLEDQLEILRGVWSTPPGEAFSYEGTHHTFRNAPALPKPEQKDGPPIIVGGTGRRRTPSLAARFADEFNMSLPTLMVYRQQMARIDAACLRIGRDPGDLIRSVSLATVCGTSPGQIERRLQRAGLTPRDIATIGVAGNPDEVIDYIAKFAKAGADRVYLDFGDVADISHLELLAAEVLEPVQSL